jgi:hypothetical protein
VISLAKQEVSGTKQTIECIEVMVYQHIMMVGLSLWSGSQVIGTGK